jgi:mono/diheme cytochrome c family protein
MHATTTKGLSMNNQILKAAALVLASLAVMAFAFGGWAVVTVDDLPRAFTVGETTSIAFTVRQHGIRPLDGLEPTVTASDGTHGEAEVRTSATTSGPVGHYMASLVVPRRGNWSVTINSGFMASQVTLYPIPAVAAKTRLPDAPPAEVGQRLFVAKGCVTCHVHGAIEGYRSLAVGPTLTANRYQPDYLAKLLADPSMARTPGRQWTMPNLALRGAEIVALVAFINADRQISAR